MKQEAKNIEELERLAVFPGLSLNEFLNTCKNNKYYVNEYGFTILVRSNRTRNASSIYPFDLIVYDYHGRHRFNLSRRLESADLFAIKLPDFLRSDRIYELAARPTFIALTNVEPESHPLFRRKHREITAP